MAKVTRIWQYEVTEVEGCMVGRVEVGVLTLDRWQGRSYTYNVYDSSVGDVTGHWTVRLIGEASEEQANAIRENWRKAREVRNAA